MTSGELGGDSGDKVYLAVPGMLHTQFRAIEKSLLQVPGVKRVRRIGLIPSERRHFELDTLLRHVTDPVLSVDREGRVVAANLAAARAFGVSIDRVPGLQLQRFLPLLQVAELLRDFAVPRFGMPVEVRGRDYRLEWVPISLPDAEEVGSLAGAVLTLQEVERRDEISRLPPPVALWDFDRRRASCLELQAAARLSSPLLITGEGGSGKSTFAAAVHYLSPLASRGEYRCLDAVGLTDSRPLWDRLPAGGTLVLEEPEKLSPGEQVALLRGLRQLPGGVRAVATSSRPERLEPGLAQFFSGLVLALPPLRSMRPAIGRFAGAALREVQRKETGGEGPPSLTLDDGAVDYLRLRDWPQNFSGLKDFLVLAAQRCRVRGDSVISAADVEENAGGATGLPMAWARGLSFREAMEKVEEGLLRELAAEQLSTREMAQRLGLSHTAIANKLRKFRISREP
nr:TyrR/PhhR family helix-turn-helix DNA-binding protein [Microbulbifer yueqingensis]